MSIRREVDLGLLDEGFVIRGDSAGDLAGRSVSSAGDVNGDGFDDLIVGASGAGEAYVIFGRTEGLADISLASLGANGFVIRGALTTAGYSVSSAGDVNGDGFDDVIIGAPGANKAYVIFGHAGAFADVDLSDLGPAGFIIQGDAAGDQAGFSVSSAGDVNGDGFEDLIIGAPGGDDGGAGAGEAYVIFGHSGGFSNVDLANLGPQGFVIVGYTEGGMFGDVAGGAKAGFSVSSAGDVNGDGFDDVIVGAPFAGYGGTYGNRPPGEAYVVFGHAGELSNIQISSLSPTEGFSLSINATKGREGSSVSSAGDLNGDGFADLIIAVPWSNGNGGAYVVFGHADANPSTLSRFYIDHGNWGDWTGASVSSAGDVNGDGFDDLIVGLPGTDRTAGQAYVIFGHAGEFGNIDLAELTPDLGFVIQGDAAGDKTGFSVSSAGDVNGDGFDDLIVGAPRGDDSGADAGEAYVIYGSATVGRLYFTGSNASDVMQGTADGDILDGLKGNDSLSGLAGNDRLYGGAGNDELRGGFGDDLLDGGAGVDTATYRNASAGVTVRLNGWPVDTGQVGIDTLINIENLIGSAYDDFLAGNGVANTINGRAGADDIRGFEGNDALHGAAGDDMLRGGLGNDAMYGGKGDDTYWVDAAGDQVIENAGEGRDLVIAEVSLTLSANVEELNLAGAGDIDGTGNELDNTIRGNSGNNVLYGSFGDDILHGRDGDDTLWGGPGADTMTGGNGNDLYRIDDPGDVVIEKANGGIDTVRATFDYVLLDHFENLVLAGSATTGTGNALDNVISGSNGDDTLAGLAGADTLEGGKGRDGLKGGAGADILFGGIGNDTLNGGSGSDVLNGGLGKDVMTGGAGQDRFVFLDGDSSLSPSTADRVTDFSQAQGDLIDLGGMDANVALAGDQKFRFIGDAAFSGAPRELRYTQVGGNTFVEGDTNGDGDADFLIRLNGLHDLMASDFVL